MSYLIAVDWGTSSFRAYCIDNTGEVLQKIDAEAVGSGFNKIQPNLIVGGAGLSCDSLKRRAELFQSRWLASRDVLFTKTFLEKS